METKKPYDPRQDPDLYRVSARVPAKEEQDETIQHVGYFDDPELYRAGPPAPAYMGVTFKGGKGE